MSTLAQLIALVEADLKDTGNTQWSDDELTNHIRRALRAYNRAAPRTTYADVTTAADVRLYSLSALTGLMEVVDVWFPHNPADPEFPPTRPGWSRPYDGYLLLESADAPSGEATEKLHVVYTCPHTIDDLDSAASTTLDAQGEELIVLGAGAYAAQQMAAATIGTVNAATRTPEDWQRFAERRLARFRAGLEELRVRRVAEGETRVAHSDPL